MPFRRRRRAYKLARAVHLELPPTGYRLAARSPRRRRQGRATRVMTREPRMANLPHMSKPHYISFPESGRTWLRAILAGLDVDLEYTHLDAIENKGHWGKHLAHLKPHNFAERQTIFLHRDPRDTAVSYFYQITKRTKLNISKTLRYTITSKIPPRTLDGFVRSSRWGVEKIATFNLMNAASLNGLGLSYEGLHNDAMQSVTDLLSFLNVQRSSSAISHAVESAAFAKMRRMEETNNIPDDLRGVLGAKDISDTNTYKVRKGQVGGFVEELEPDTIAYCEQVLKRLNYQERIAEYLSSQILAPAQVTRE